MVYLSKLPVNTKEHRMASEELTPTVEETGQLPGISRE